MNRSIFLLALLLIPALVMGQKKGGRVVLTPKTNGLVNISEFSCYDTVHGYLTLPEKAVGAHTIEGIWIMPNGQVGEHSKNKVEFPAPGRQTAYVWLMFQNKADGFLGNVREGATESAATNPLSGQWQLKVLWDGQPLVESKFKVKCS